MVRVKKMVNMRHHYFFTKNTPELTEIINNTRGGIDGKIGERGALRAIQVPDVHSFTISQTKNRFRRVFVLFKLFFAVKILKISFQIV